MLVLMSNRVVIDERFVGMESRAIPTIMQDFAQRRELLVNQVLYWQSSTLLANDQERSDMLRRASETTSRPSVLYSHYIAKASARNLR